MLLLGARGPATITMSAVGSLSVFSLPVVDRTALRQFPILQDRLPIGLPPWVFRERVLGMKSVRTWLFVAAVLALCSAPSTGQDAPGPGKEGANGDQGDSKALSPEQLFAKASPAIVKVHVYDKSAKLRSQGSGFFVSPDGLLVTNHHVISKAASAKVLLSDGSKLDVLGMVASLLSKDLALLKVKGTKLSSLKLARAAPKVGTKVFAIGSPEGLTNTISEGLVSGYRDFKNGPRLLQTTAAVSAGSSGGPLLVSTGEVVGVTTLVWRTGQNLNFAVPSKYVRALILTAGKPRPLAGAQPEQKAPAFNGEAQAFDSFDAILRHIPETLFPRDRKPRNWTKLTSDLFNDWARKSLIGSVLSLQKIRWNDGQLIDRIRLNEVTRSRLPGTEGPKIFNTLYYRERCTDGRTYYVYLKCYFSPETSAELTPLKLGARVNIHGRIAYVRVLASPSGVRIRKDYFAPAPHRTERGYFTDKTGVTVSLALLECHVSAYDPRSRPKPMPIETKRRPSRVPTGDEKATRKLELARSYLSAGMKQKAIEILKSILADLPKTEAAKEARKELRRLSSGE